ncbi:MAG: hypothetical protein ACM31E_12300 [Fibrobacterota bacterium]
MKTSISKKIMVQDVEANSMYDDTFTVYPYSLTPLELEAVVVMERLNLYNNLKPCGAVALRHHLKNMGIEQLPSVRTIGRILSKHCLTNYRTGYYPEDYQ